MSGRPHRTSVPRDLQFSCVGERKKEGWEGGRCRRSTIHSPCAPWMSFSQKKSASFVSILISGTFRSGTVLFRRTRSNLLAASFRFEDVSFAKTANRHRSYAISMQFQSRAERLPFYRAVIASSNSSRADFRKFTRAAPQAISEESKRERERNARFLLHTHRYSTNLP